MLYLVFLILGIFNLHLKLIKMTQHSTLHYRIEITELTMLSSV